MVDIDDAVIEELVHEGSSMDRDDLFDVIERHHDDRPGVPRQAVAAYARELASRRDYSFDADGFLAALDERRTDEETWAGHDWYYELDDDRVSQYPAAWHEHLGESTDAAEYVRFINERAPDFAEELGRGGPETAVPKDALVDVLQAVGRMDREAATTAIEQAREHGALAEDVDQHPEAGVYPAEE